MKRQRNASCVYTGLVGRKMPLRKPTTSKRIKRHSVKLIGGPFGGVQVRLDADTPADTLPLQPFKGFPAGRYVSGIWRPATENPNEALQDHLL